MPTGRPAPSTLIDRVRIEFARRRARAEALQEPALSRPSPRRPRTGTPPWPRHDR